MIVEIIGKHEKNMFLFTKFGGSVSIDTACKREIICSGPPTSTPCFNFLKEIS